MKVEQKETSPTADLRRPSPPPPSLVWNTKNLLRPGFVLELIGRSRLIGYASRVGSPDHENSGRSCYFVTMIFVPRVGNSDIVGRFSS
ncbi:hypothetical protein AKJ16_DCAP07312 [Drosera capensis]